MTVNGMKWK